MTSGSTRFFLIPFPGEENPAGVTVGGSIARRGNTLSVRYEVRGNLSKMSIPVAAEAPRRKDRLWEETCLELFLGTAESWEYREVNLSPSGHWNIYRFTRYREGMREESVYSSLPFGVRIGPGTLRLSLDLGIGRILPPLKAARIGVAAVIRTIDGGISRWALVHPGPRPDFHDPNGFALTQPPAKLPCRPRSRVIVNLKVPPRR